MRGSERLVAIVQELSLARTAEAVQKVACTAARELTGADGATFVLRSGERCHYVDEDAVAPLWMGSRFPLSECLSGWVMEHAEPVVIPDIYADDRVPTDAYRSKFVKSLAIVPIRANEPIGAIGAYWANEHLAGVEEVELLRELADSTSIALENVDLYAQLVREAEEQAHAARAARQLAEEQAYSAQAARRAEQEARSALELRRSQERRSQERRSQEGELPSSEQQRQESQKMEAIGRFAGGIAHDFNNVLSVILSYCSLAREEASPGEPLAECLEEIQKAAERATELTQQLLAFGGRQRLRRQRVDLNGLVSDVEGMLGPMLGDGIRLEVRRAAGLHPVASDAGQLQQALVNLVLNARDAMPEGGQVVVETRDVVLDDEYARQHVGARPGPHVMLAVSDTGRGMDGDAQLRVFEPFFTTKPPGVGSGLGLPTAYGIVKQSGGNLEVESAPGQGTTFRVFLPRWESARPFREGQARPGLAH